jgi:hypothetical protein
LIKNGHLRSFITSGICECFTQPGHRLHPFSKDQQPDCFCDRQRYLTCKDCGAACAWFLDAGRLGLSYRYIWDIDEPTSASWLAFLDQDSYRDRLFKEDTRNVLWCDSPQCVVANGRRWEAMIKQNMVEQSSSSADLQRAQRRAREVGYRMPREDLPRRKLILPSRRIGYRGSYTELRQALLS